MIHELALKLIAGVAPIEHPIRDFFLLIILPPTIAVLTASVIGGIAAGVAAGVATYLVEMYFRRRGVK